MGGGTAREPFGRRLKEGGGFMSSEEILKKRLARLEKWSGSFAKIWQKEIDVIDTHFEKAAQELESERQRIMETFRTEEAKVRDEVDQAGKDFSQRKYQMERDS